MAPDPSANDQYRLMAAAELHALLDAAVDAIVVIDDRGRVTTFNKAAERMFGYAAADMIGQNISILMGEPDRTQHDAHIERYKATGEARIIGIGREVQARRANGEIFPIALSVGEARDAGGRRFVGILRDLSSERAAEQQTRSLEARLAHVGRFNLMGEMAAGIAHEINQPLSAIATYAQAAKRIMDHAQPNMATLREICTKIDDQARRAGQVIENLRKFIRKQEISTQSLDVNRVVRDVMNLIEADAHAEGIPVRVEAAEGLPSVRADAVQLQQVLLNLTRNSVDAMRGGLAKDRGITIATQRNERGGVRITVTDHGHGVSRQLGDNIFHPFVTTKREGLGVGLAISRTIVQSYDGSLTYTDNPVGGAIFSIDLPAERESSAA
ncbi:MAG TPA: PAS domain S-box protein [Gammaproteobacteria bacterium]|jgi:two-component system sensor kinase FixL|nr:PAS domain S-box protein [Gammaproteobacteria bacterium]